MWVVAISSFGIGYTWAIQNSRLTGLLKVVGFSDQQRTHCKPTPRVYKQCMPRAFFVLCARSFDALISPLLHVRSH